MASNRDVTGELRDLLAVIHSSVTLLGRRKGIDGANEKHVRRIQEYVARAGEAVARLENG